MCRQFPLTPRFSPRRIFNSSCLVKTNNVRCVQLYPKTSFQYGTKMVENRITTCFIVPSVPKGELT